MDRRSDKPLDGDDILCVVCNLYFPATSSRKAICYACIGTDLDRDCELCGKRFKITDHNLGRGPLWICPKNAEQMQTRCTYCIGNVKHICRCCGNSYIQRPIIDAPSCAYKCNECTMTSYYLTETLGSNHTFPGGLKEGYKLVITYDIHIQTHDGYCSDPYNEEELDREGVCEYPLMNVVTEEQITKFMENQYSSDINPINYYVKCGGPCGGGGSGYCGMYSTYRVKNIEIVKDDSKRIIKPEDYIY
jgi:hypothetical protein